CLRLLQTEGYAPSRLLSNQCNGHKIRYPGLGQHRMARVQAAQRWARTTGSGGWNSRLLRRDSRRDAPSGR
ncbi:hypothetical protein PMAYCL1PPCAC_03079, partial [Pristionchus mayeri]